MSTDRELLTLAAKAVNGGSWHPLTHDTPNGTWNPLTDDGDALRLAVKLGLEIVPLEGGCVDVIRWLNGKDSERVSECATDPYAATRRAIVRAAAAIGGAK